MNLEECASRGMKAQQAVDDLARIERSVDVLWLRSLMGDQDNQLTIRKAAQRRLRILAKLGGKR